MSFQVLNFWLGLYKLNYIVPELFRWAWESVNGISSIQVYNKVQQSQIFLAGLT